MNENVIKKIGEAHAFAQGLENLKMGLPEVLEALLGEHAGGVIDAATKQQIDLSEVAEAGGMSDMMIEKAGRTLKKITEMGEKYVGDDWDDPAEVLEWLSFFLGAAVIHWQLITGSAKELGDERFVQIASGGAEYYFTLFSAARTKAEAIGRTRAQSA